MESTKQKVEKNILDIEHQRYLTYFNTSIIISITSAFSLLISYLSEKIDITLFELLIFFVMVIGSTAILIFRSKMNRKISEIRALIK